MVFFGYIHNDLHAANVAIRDENNLDTKAVIIDFGLTRKLPTRPDNKLLFDQLLVSQLYALIEPCNENNCPDKTMVWPTCGFKGKKLEKLCDGLIATEIYSLRNNTSNIWESLLNAFEIESFEISITE